MTGFEPFFNSEVTILDATGKRHKGTLVEVKSPDTSSSGEEEILLNEVHGPVFLKCSDILDFRAAW